MPALRLSAAAVVAMASAAVGCSPYPGIPASWYCRDPATGMRPGYSNFDLNHYVNGASSTPATVWTLAAPSPRARAYVVDAGADAMVDAGEDAMVDASTD